MYHVHPRLLSAPRLVSLAIVAGTMIASVPPLLAQQPGGRSNAVKGAPAAEQPCPGAGPAAGQAQAAWPAGPWQVCGGGQACGAVASAHTPPVEVQATRFPLPSQLAPTWQTPVPGT